jgi:Xaa-Pro aminopeptidase
VGERADESAAVARPADLIRAKHRQAAALLPRFGLDAWLISFARETGLRPDPVDYLVGAPVTWPSAFLLDRDGRSSAIVATGNQSVFERLGAWDEVRAYVASPREELMGWLRDRDPAAIGLTFSASDHTADSLTQGMRVYLESLLAGSRWSDRLKPAGDLASEVRRVKLPDEVDSIRRAVEACEALHARIAGRLELGLTEAQLQREVWGWIEEAGYGFAWAARGDPIVNFGLVDAEGHVGPRERKGLEPGDVVHIDLGVTMDGFASDLQRTYYWRRRGEQEAPAAVQRAFDAVIAALDAGTAALRPGVRGHEVDAAARRTVQAHGFPEPEFAFGHHCGRVAHDGGGVLGPRWDRYGEAPNFAVGAGNVFAVEVELEPEGYPGMVGVEEEVVVTEAGIEFLSSRQVELRLLG